MTANKNPFINDIGQLASRAMLVNLDVHFWEGFKADKLISEEVETLHKTQGNYNKRLIPKDALTPLRSAYAKVETIHKTYTLPWSDDGDRVISSEAYFTYTQKMGKAIDEFNQAADELASKYEDLVEERRRIESHKTFNEKFYPSKEDLRAKFGVDIRYKPIPQGNDLRINMSADAVAAVKASIDQDQQKRIEQAVNDIAERINETVGKMVVKLREYRPAKKSTEKTEGSFRDSLIENVAALAKLLPSLNITGNPKIDQMAKDLDELMKTSKPWVLRSDTRLCEKTAKAAEQILAKVSEFI